MFQTEVVQKIKTHILCSVIPPPENRAVCAHAITTATGWQPICSLIIIMIKIFDMAVPRHMLFLPSTSLEPALIPTAHASSFTLQHFPYCVCCSECSCLLWLIYRMFIVIIIIIRYGCPLSQACSSRYFSRTSADPHRPRFKLHTAALSVLCVLFRV